MISQTWKWLRGRHVISTKNRTVKFAIFSFLKFKLKILPKTKKSFDEDPDLAFGHNDGLVLGRNYPWHPPIRHPEGCLWYEQWQFWRDYGFVPLHVCRLLWPRLLPQLKILTRNGGHRPTIRIAVRETRGRIWKGQYWGYWWARSHGGFPYYRAPQRLLFRGWSCEQSLSRKRPRALSDEEFHPVWALPCLSAYWEHGWLRIRQGKWE